MSMPPRTSADPAPEYSLARARCSVYIATSVDGFIARRDGAIDWLQRASAVVPPGEDCGYGAFMATVDAIVMGRLTFDTVRAFGEWPYGKTPVVVMSRQALALPSGLPDAVGASNEAPAALVERLYRAGARRLYIDGGQLVQSFLRDGLIDDLTITVIPILLGDGQPLFGPLQRDVELEHLRTQAWDFGFVQREYRVRGRGR